MTVEVSVWSHTGDRAGLDRVIDTEVRRQVGAGRWTRHCGTCAGDRHGRRIFVPVAGDAFAVSVAHAGSSHVAATTWGASGIGVDLEHVDTAETLGDLPLWPGDTDATPGDRLARWVAHEARVKIMGRGLGQDPSPVPLLREPSDRLVHAHGLWWRRLQGRDRVCIVASDCYAVLQDRSG